MNQFNWDTSFFVDFDLKSGISKKAETTKRYLSQMKDMYYDTDSAERILEESDPLIYEFHELGCPERSGDLAFGTTILYPGILYDQRAFSYNPRDGGGVLHTERGRLYGDGEPGGRHA